jgi:protein phosphatase slingshot
MMVILGQADKASEIFDYLSLGTEWNASHLDELESSGHVDVVTLISPYVRSCRYIINVTKEIENYFPDKIKYYTIRFAVSIWCTALTREPRAALDCARCASISLTARSVYDVPHADLLHHWEDTYRFIREAKYGRLCLPQCCFIKSLAVVVMLLCIALAYSIYLLFSHCVTAQT